MKILEIKVNKIVNNTKDGYGRMAMPITHTWQWRPIALSRSRRVLEKYVTALPDKCFYLRKHDYRIIENAIHN